MLIMIEGGSGSGKSAYAEKRALELKEQKLYYLATMRIFDEEGKVKVSRHKEQRAGKGFITIEQPDCIEEAINRIEKDSVVLLECMSNLIANEMFKGEPAEDTELVADKVLEGIKLLKNKVKHIIVVTNNIFEDGICYTKETMEYMEALGRVNTKLAQKAEEVTEVTAGIPIERKTKRSNQP